MIVTITISSFALNRSISIQYDIVEPTRRNIQAYTDVGSWRTGSFGLHIVAFGLDYYFGCIDTNNNTTRKHNTKPWSTPSIRPTDWLCSLYKDMNDLTTRISSIGIEATTALITSLCIALLYLFPLSPLNFIWISEINCFLLVLVPIGKFHIYRLEIHPTIWFVLAQFCPRPKNEPPPVLWYWLFREIQTIVV